MGEGGEQIRNVELKIEIDKLELMKWEVMFGKRLF